MAATTKTQTLKALRDELISFDGGFTEHRFETLKTAMLAGNRVAAVKEMRAIREMGLRDALNVTDKWMKKL